MLAGLIVAPPATVAFLVARYARNVPFKDQWGIVPFVAEIAHGHLRIAWLLTQVNEHRIPLTLLVQGLVSWPTRWDVRYESWMNVLAAAATLVALGGLVRRTVGPLASVAPIALLAVCSALVFSVAGGTNWTWGSLNATYFAGLAAATLAWLVAGWRPTPASSIRLVVVASLGALSFGTGVLLPILVPLGLLVTPIERRAPHVIATAAWAALVVGLYFVGWHPRFGSPPPVMHWNRGADYARYAVAYLGGFAASTGFVAAFHTGLALLALLLGATGWVVVRRSPDVRGALPAWWLLAGYALGSALLTAFGRLDNGIGTALFGRYLPTQSFMAIATAGVVVIALRDLRQRQPLAGFAGIVLVLAATMELASSLPLGVREGISQMALLSRDLDGGARCLAARSAASDACLRSVCWDAGVARRMLPLLEEAKIGPFAE